MASLDSGVLRWPEVKEWHDYMASPLHYRDSMGGWRQAGQFRIAGSYTPRRMRPPAALLMHRARMMRRKHGQGVCSRPGSVVGFGGLAMRQNPSPL